MFICTVLTATVTWSGAGCSSASMCPRVVREHFASAPSPSGEKEMEPPTWQDQLWDPGANSASSSVEAGKPLGALAVRLAHVDVQRRWRGVVAIDRLLDVLLHRDRDVLGEV